MRTGVLLAFTAMAAWQDWRRKEISWWIFGCFGLASVLLLFRELAAGQPWGGYLAGMLPGIFLLLCGKLTGGRIGDGDGVFFIISGLLLGAERNLELFLESVLLCGVFSMCWYVRRLFSVRLTGKEELPFLPFSALALFAGQILRQCGGIMK